MAPILQVFVVGCSAAVVAIATRAFRVADSVPPSLTGATHSTPNRDCLAPSAGADRPLERGDCAETGNRAGSRERED